MRPLMHPLLQEKLLVLWHFDFKTKIYILLIQAFAMEMTKHLKVPQNTSYHYNKMFQGSANRDIKKDLQAAQP
jgi:hypothetical protein